MNKLEWESIDFEIVKISIADVIATSGDDDVFEQLIPGRNDQD